VTRPEFDPVAVQLDDVLVDMIGGRDTHGADVAAAEPALGLLYGWRQEVDARPVGELVDVDTAVAVIVASRPAPVHHARRVRHPVLSGCLDVLAVLATPVVEWADDLTTWERVHRLVAALLLVAAVIAVLSAGDPAVIVR